MKNVVRKLSVLRIRFLNRRIKYEIYLMNILEKFIKRINKRIGRKQSKRHILIKNFYKRFGE